MPRKDQKFSKIRSRPLSKIPWKLLITSNGLLFSLLSSLPMIAEGFDCREVAGLWQPFPRLQMINSLFWAQQNTTLLGTQGKRRWEAVVRWRKEEEKEEENNSALHNYSQQQSKRLAAAASTALHVIEEQWPAQRPPQSSQHLQHFTLKKAYTFVFPNPTTSHRSFPSG